MVATAQSIISDESHSYISFLLHSLLTVRCDLSPKVWKYISTSVFLSKTFPVFLHMAYTCFKHMATWHRSEVNSEVVSKPLLQWSFWFPALMFQHSSGAAGQTAPVLWSHAWGISQTQTKRACKRLHTRASPLAGYDVIDVETCICCFWKSLLKHFIR